MKNSLDLICNETELQQDELVNISGGDAADVGYAIGYTAGFVVGYAIFIRRWRALVLVCANKYLK